MTFVFHLTRTTSFFGVPDDDIIYIHLISKDTVSFFLFAFVTEKEGFCQYFGSKKTGHEIETNP